MAARPASRRVSSLRGFKGQLVLVGAGNMGGAMLAGWIARGLPPKKIIVYEPKPSSAVKALRRKGISLNPKVAPRACSVMVVAVKPQVAPDVLPPLADVAAKAMVLSIMAGRTIRFLEQTFSNRHAIVRSMPNLPAAIGQGTTVAVANDRASAAQKKLASALLAAVGSVAFVDDERQMDAVTATSGSGPAYVFLLAEALAAAGAAAGLPPALAAQLARDTVIGSGALLAQSPLDAATLRKNVTSPGGTTAAALAVLMGPGDFEALMTRAVAAAARRSRELAG